MKYQGSVKEFQKIVMQNIGRNQTQLTKHNTHLENYGYYLTILLKKIKSKEKM